MDPSSLNSAFRRFVTFFTVKGCEGPGRNRWRNIGSLHPIYKGKINVPIIIKYTSRKKYGSIFSCCYTNQKNKKDVSHEENNNNKTGMHAICFKDEQAKVLPSQHGRHNAKVGTRASLTKNYMYTGALVNIFNGNHK